MTCTWRPAPLDGWWIYGPDAVLDEAFQTGKAVEVVEADGSSTPVVIQSLSQPDADGNSVAYPSALPDGNPQGPK